MLQKTRLRLKVLSARECISQISDIVQKSKYIYTQKVNTEDRYYYIYVISSKIKGKTAYDCGKNSKS